MATETLKLGDEYEEKLVAILGSVLRELGADLEDSWTGVGGSQEIHHWDVLIRGHSVIVETETYVGLTITGDAELVREIAHIVSDRASE